MEAHKFLWSMVRHDRKTGSPVVVAVEKEGGGERSGSFCCAPPSLERENL